MWKLYSKQSLRNRIFPSSVVRSILDLTQSDAVIVVVTSANTRYTMLLYQWPFWLEAYKTRRPYVHGLGKIQLPKRPVIVTKRARTQVGAWRLRRTPSTSAITRCGIWKLEQENHMTWHGQMVGWRFQWNAAMFSHPWNFNSLGEGRWQVALKIRGIKFSLVTAGTANAGTWMSVCETRTLCSMVEFFFI